MLRGFGRPSVASTCCASRSHFTPLSSPNSVPSFFLFFNFFYHFYINFILHSQNDTPYTDLYPIFLPHFLNFPAIRAQLLYASLYRSGNEYAYYTVFSALCFTVCTLQRKLYIYFFYCFLIAPYTRIVLPESLFPLYVHLCRRSFRFPRVWLCRTRGMNFGLVASSYSV